MMRGTPIARAVALVRTQWRAAPWVLTVAAALALSACRDGLLYDAAEPRTAQLSIQPSIAQAAGGVLDAYTSVDNITLTFASGGETRLTQSLPFNGSAEAVAISIQVPLRASAETFQLSAELRRGADPVFRGNAELEISTGEVSPIELALQPVVAQVTCSGATVVLDAYGATTQITAAALFATGDTIPGRTITWSTSSAGVATVQQNGVVTAVADGEATIRCAVGDIVGTRTVQVAAVVTSVTVTPATASIAPGGTQAFTAVLRDRRGNALSGRPITWTSASPAIASVNSAGVATGVAPGTARIDASSGTATGSATLTVASLPPVVTTNAASGLTAAGATLNGSVNPRGAATQAWFEYGTSPTLAGSTSTPQQSVGAGGTAVAISRSLTQLLPNTTYYFRAAASNSAGTTRGEIRSFRLDAPPSATTLPATVQSGTVRFNGQTNPNGLSTQAWFEWGTSPSLTTYSETAVVNAGAGRSAVSVSTSASGLARGTDYYVRLVARSAAGTTRGSIVQFRTDAGSAPNVETLGSSYDGQLYFFFGQVEPNGAPTDAWFEYSFDYADLAFFQSTQAQSIDGSAGPTEFMGTLPFQGSVLWFRAAALNEFGIVRGEIQEAYAFSMANWGRPMIPHAALRVLALLLAVLLLPAAAAAQQQQQDRRPGIAVLPFELGISIGAERETLDALSVGVQQILITELAQNPALRVVDRSIVRDLMAEQDLGASGRIDAQTAARIGRMVGARYVVAGGFNDNDGNFRLDGRIVDVETTEVLKADQVTDRRANLYAIIMSLGNRLVQGVELPALPREVRSERESRGASIPREAVVLYSQAQFFADRGQTDRARELYRRITTEFPQMTEAQEALRQIGLEG